MRERCTGLVATIAASVTIACGDAAVENPTAPPSAATPASPVANQFPTASEILASGANASAIGIQITVTPYFENEYRTYGVTAGIHFQSANEVSASINGWLINERGTRVNEGSAGFTFTRFGIPVAQGDTTIDVRISTNNITCGLTGKSTYKGTATTRAIGMIALFSQSIDLTSGDDFPQPACPPAPPPDECDTPVARVIGGFTGVKAAAPTSCDDAPAPPPGGGAEMIEVCYTVWLEYWIYDFMTNTFRLISSWPIGTTCHLVMA
jgi:hypothetical protein